jgi:hypothetical protein
MALAFSALAPYEIRTVTAFRARWLCWVVALLAALPLAGPGADRFFCRSMGVVLDACCCGARAQERVHAEVERRASVEAPSCCERVKGASSDALTFAFRSGDGPAALPLLATAPSPSTLLAAPEGREVALEPVEARAPPPRGPPLFLENCVLLI